MNSADEILALCAALLLVAVLFWRVAERVIDHPNEPRERRERLVILTAIGTVYAVLLGVVLEAIIRENIR